jgi:gluconolactonase
MTRIAPGFINTEGPLWHPDGYLLFSDIDGNTIYKWIPDIGIEIFGSPSGNSNGSTLDGKNRLIACEHGNRRVSSTESDGTTVSLAEEFQGERLNSPNDVVVRSDDTIYFNDPPYGIM